jgi:hypothetical protein
MVHEPLTPTARSLIAATGRHCAGARRKGRSALTRAIAALNKVRPLPHGRAKHLLVVLDALRAEAFGAGLLKLGESDHTLLVDLLDEGGQEAGADLEKELSGERGQCGACCRLSLDLESALGLGGNDTVESDELRGVIGHSKVE